MFGIGMMIGEQCSILPSRKLMRFIMISSSFYINGKILAKSNLCIGNYYRIPGNTFLSPVINIIARKVLFVLFKIFIALYL